MTRCLLCQRQVRVANFSAHMQSHHPEAYERIYGWPLYGSLHRQYGWPR